jgi:hypothetical protein
VYFGLVHTKADSVFKGAQALLADDRLEAVGGSNLKKYNKKVKVRLY